MFSLFLVSFFTLLYVYVLYPLHLRVLPKKQVHSDLSAQPTVTVIIPAYNEEGVIEATIRNKFEQDFPQERLSVVVVSDCSTDSTEQIVERLQLEYGKRLTLISQKERQGKTAGVNQAVAACQSDILVFADANSMYASTTVSELATALRASDVGYVTGKMVYVNEDGSMIGDGCSAYMRYENHLRALESRIGSVVGVDGGVDAMKRSLYVALKPEQLPDFVQPLKVVEQGFRVVYQPNALLKEHALNDASSEFSMRVRVSLRALWSLLEMRWLFNPFTYGFFSWQLFTHKLLRYLAFIPMLLCLLSSVFLSLHSALGVILLLGQLFFYGLAIWGHFVPKSSSSLVRLSYYFCVINIAALVAFSLFVRGRRIVTWTPRVGR